MAVRGCETLGVGFGKDLLHFVILGRLELLVIEAKSVAAGQHLARLGRHRETAIGHCRSEAFWH